MVASNRASGRPLLFALLAGTAISTTTPAFAQSSDLATMRAQIEALTRQIEALEAAQAQESARVDVVEERVSRTPVIQPEKRNPNSVGFKTRDFVQADQFRPSDGTAFLLGNTEVEIGGFAKLDFIYDFDESTGDLLSLPGISVIDGPSSDNEAFRAHANESRLFFKANTPTSIGDVDVHIEADFFSSTIASNELVTNSFPFRLRHAYGSIDTGRHEFLAGQFWSAFVPIEAYPSTVDFGGPAGNSFLRQAQFRYTYKPTENLQFVLSAENSETSFRTNALELGGGAGSASTVFGVNANLDTLPDLVASARYMTEDGHIKGSLLFRELNAPDTTDPLLAPGAGEEELGYGVQLSGAYDITDRLQFRGSALYGEGVGRYLFAGVNQGAFLGTAGVNSTLGVGEFEAIETVSGYARLAFDATDSITFVGTLGYYDLIDEFTEFDTDQLQSVHASMYWAPVDDFVVGTEVIYADRELANGDDDDLVRLQASVKWSF